MKYKWLLFDADVLYLVINKAELAAFKKTFEVASKSNEFERSLNG